MIRSLIKTGAAAALRAGGGLALRRRLRRRRGYPLVVSHHRVAPDPAAQHHAIPSMFVSCRELEWEIDRLGRDYRFVSVDELDPASCGDGDGKPPIALTFDDGYRDFYEHAFPVLERKGIPAAVFVISDLVGTDEIPLHDRLWVLSRAWWRAEPDPDWAGLLRRAGVQLDPGGGDLPAGDPFDAFRRVLTRLPRRDLEALAATLARQVDVDDDVWRGFRIMSWDMLRRLRAAGITIGSHGRSHVLMPNESPDRVRDEILGSRRDLERGLDDTVDAFAYPDGRFDSISVGAVAGAGFRLAFACCACRSDDHPHLTVPRRHLWSGALRDAFGRLSPSLLACQIAGAFDRPHRCPVGHRRWRRAAPPALPERRAEVA